MNVAEEKLDKFYPISMVILQLSLKKIKGTELQAGYTRSALIMFLDSSKPVLFVFLRHFDEVPQALFELFRSLARAIDKPDPDALVGG